MEYVSLKCEESLKIAVEKCRVKLKNEGRTIEYIEGYLEGFAEGFIEGLNKGVLPYVAPGQRKKLTKNTKKAFIIPGNSFTMPNYDCTITGYFEPKK
mgnify:CR=1 FL=1